MRLAATILLSLAPVFAQGQQHVAWSLRTEPASAAAGGTVRIFATAQIDPGWHLYSASSAAGIPATFQVSPGTLTRVLQTPPKRAFDSVLNAEAETYEDNAGFLLEVKLPADAPVGAANVAVNIRYQTCDDRTCVPGKWSGTAVAMVVDQSTHLPEPPPIPANFAEAKRKSGTDDRLLSSVNASDQDNSAAASQGWGAFLLIAFGFGLASIFTPCVFPMIPITMSYFLNQQGGSKRDGVVQAIVFCLGIIVLFTGLGLLATAILGPVGVKQLGSNPWVNGFISALFIAFGLSLLGAFEITIPSSVLTRLNQSSNQGGFAGTLLMGLTFSLSSFACVGPFVGTLLAASVSGGRARPAIGMLTFATGLALPFFFLALFPSYLKRLPRSGGWMARVKVVMGFVILAASLKYLSGLDQVLQWGFLTRERFLAAWIVLFGLAGLYLLGFLRMEGVKHEENVGLGRLIVGMALMIFALSLLPGMSGGKLGSLDAFVPMAAESSSSAGATDGTVWMKDQYRQALDRARAEQKLVFIDFTGYACANCHWMRANTLARPEIVALLKDFVLLELYTDGTDAASEANSKLQLDKFGTVALPFYVILDPDEKLIAKFEGLTHDSAEFAAFLKKGQLSAPAATSSTAPAPPASTSPSAAPEYPAATRLEGGPLDVAALQGKVVVVNFWATWCVPCIGELPTFNKIHHDLAPKGVAVIGISMDDDGATKVPSFLKKHPIDYPVALGNDALGDKYKLDALPVTLIYNKQGHQVKRFEGAVTEADLMAAIDQAK